jgi:hypothetical protein
VVRAISVYYISSVAAREKLHNCFVNFQDSTACFLINTLALLCRVDKPCIHTPFHTTHTRIQHTPTNRASRHWGEVRRRRFAWKRMEERSALIAGEIGCK